MTIYRTSLSKTVTIVRDPKDHTKDYQLPADLAFVLYEAGKLCIAEDISSDMIGYEWYYCTPNIDDPEIGLHIPASYDPPQIVDTNLPETE